MSDRKQLPTHDSCWVLRPRRLLQGATATVSTAGRYGHGVHCRALRPRVYCRALRPWCLLQGATATVSTAERYGHGGS